MEQQCLREPHWEPPKQTPLNFLSFAAMRWIPSCSRTRVWEGRELGEEGQGQELNTGIYELPLAAWGRGSFCQNNI